MSSSAACANASTRLVQLYTPLLYVLMLPDLARAEGSASSGQQVFAISREFRVKSSIAVNRQYFLGPLGKVTLRRRAGLTP